MENKRSCAVASAADPVGESSWNGRGAQAGDDGRDQFRLQDVAIENGRRGRPVLLLMLSRRGRRAVVISFSRLYRDLGGKGEGGGFTGVLLVSTLQNKKNIPRRSEPEQRTNKALLGMLHLSSWGWIPTV